MSKCNSDKSVKAVNLDRSRSNLAAPWVSGLLHKFWEAAFIKGLIVEFFERWHSLKVWLLSVNLDGNSFELHRTQVPGQPTALLQKSSRKKIASKDKKWTI